ncbi:hypothetical protein EC960109_5811A, partial [Escherichia coli 96.0109]
MRAPVKWRGSLP